MREKLTYGAAKAAQTIETTFKTIRDADETQDLINFVKKSPTAMKTAGVLGASAVVSAINPIINAMACTEEQGSCSTNPATAFVTAAVIGTAAIYAHGRFFSQAKPVREEPAAERASTPLGK